MIHFFVYICILQLIVTLPKCFSFMYPTSIYYALFTHVTALLSGRIQHVI